MYSRMIASIGVVASLVLAACGPTAKPAADGTLTLTISNPANVSNVPLHIAMDKGFFAAEGLTIKADVDLGSGSTVEAVVGGQVDMAWTNVVSALTVYGKGLGLKMVAVTDVAVEGSQQVLVAKDSPARGLADLAGKKVAVLSPNTICVLSIRTALRAQALAQDSIAFAPVAPPEHANVLSSGEVAATCTSDPFRTLMIEKLGARPILDSSVNELAAYPVGGYVVSTKFAGEHGDALTRFQRALRKATEFANANPAAVREALPKFANVDAEVANRVVINRFVEAADTATVRTKVQAIADAMQTYQMVGKPVDVAGFLLG